MHDLQSDIVCRTGNCWTDKSLDDIAVMKARSEPMATKMELARAIVADFHSAGLRPAARPSDFDREVRQHDVPLDIETVRFRPGGHNLARLLWPPAVRFPH